MTDRMRPFTLHRHLTWIVSEYSKYGTVFGLPKERFIQTARVKPVHFFGEECTLPLGPAAGPHTQLAENIAAAYLVGGRFFELKTVQKMDALEFEKPCIDALDEGYNTEWSTELTLEQAFTEYVYGWVLLHVLKTLFDMDSPDSQGFIFNMSVGYDLKGIQTDKMQHFINSMIDASTHPVFLNAIEELKTFAKDETNWRDAPENLKIRIRELEKTADAIRPDISRSVTLSTMHGCPPAEIESICRYLLTEKCLHTYVKLNPTLLGHNQVSDTFLFLGFKDIVLDPESFEKDLQYEDAVPMLKRLMRLAEEKDLSFGVKLSNTLGVKNTKRRLPGDEMYMSGRSLYPLTMMLSEKLAMEFDGKLPISYSGGANQGNVADILSTGIRPVTVATELLKPGGYLRLAAMTEEISRSRLSWRNAIDAGAVQELADAAFDNFNYDRDWRQPGTVSVPGKLPLMDCFVAPCKVACPIHQDVPDYIRLVGEKRYEEALRLIYTKNALPHITGYICDHQCMFHCTRLDYEGAVQIREMKRIAAERGYDNFTQNWKRPDSIARGKVAVLGAGPAGLSCAYFLAVAGMDVTVFEKEMDAGGVVRNVLPDFRIPEEALQNDIDFIQAQGVHFQFGCEPEFSVSELKSRGFSFIFLGIGAEWERKLKIEGNNRNVIGALDFLKAYNNDPESLHPGKNVAVIGGGNTAMDSARAAARLPGVEEVAIIYRRTYDEMPADIEEFDNAIEEGVQFLPLLNPESLKNGILTCRVMELGEPDAGGRPRPEPTEETVELSADTVIAAIGEQVNPKFPAENNIALNPNGTIQTNPETLETSEAGVYAGGDAVRGPSTVVESIADGRKAAEAIIRKQKPDWNGLLFPETPVHDPQKSQEKAIYDKGRLLAYNSEDPDALVAEVESIRCLQCDEVCNKCVEVCPNRANIMVTLADNTGHNLNQILHIEDLCNECGNCATFCPYDGAPYKDKLTLFGNTEDFGASMNDGFLVEAVNGETRIRYRVGKAEGTGVLTDTGTVNFGTSALNADVRQFIETVVTRYRYTFA
ncbi:MAG: putative selenate reductase subunit YgfK [Acidobacteria bacterium]|nr:putative selenate reductase subunit YgfK [Acidobacteriota bacterium]